MKKEVNKVDVSIVCTTFNHELFIKDALDGFIRQKTNFRYEIIVHDDASTDRTKEIVKQYAKKYPHLIKTVFQSENQYSKGVKIFNTFILPLIKGKYVAFCEGDDYWSDSFKLQKQYDALEANQGVDICAHAHEVFDCRNKTYKIVRRRNDSCIIPVEEVIVSGGSFVATNSLVCRKLIFDNEPNFRKNCPYDYTLQVTGSLKGGMLYLNDIMSVYRYMAKGSWSERIQRNKKMKKQHIKMWLNMLKQMDADTNFKYHIVISKRILLSCISEYNALKTNLKIRNENYSVFNSLSSSDKIRLILKIYFGWFFIIRNFVVFTLKGGSNNEK